MTNADYTTTRNTIINEYAHRKDVHRVEYKNGLTLSIGTGSHHYSHKVFGLNVTVEIAIFRSDGRFASVFEFDDVARVTVDQLEEIAITMQELSLVESEALEELKNFFRKY